jgi:dipeptidyl aminopeptidase/acylaminoacyl peptidase
MKSKLLSIALLASGSAIAQKNMTPDLLWSLNRVSAQAVSADNNSVFFQSKKYDVKSEKATSTNYVIDINTGKKKKINHIDGKQVFQYDKNNWYATDDKNIYKSQDEGKTWSTLRTKVEDADNFKVSPDGKYIAYSKEVLVEKVLGKDKYPNLSKNTAQIYTDLNYRHWDAWYDGKHTHVFIESIKGGTSKDILKGLPFDCPQKPMGGAEDFVWTPNSDGIVYVCKKLAGKAYATSTNTDIYLYSIKDSATTNLTEGMKGYDMNPVFSPDGNYLAFTSMKRDGYEADKNDLYVMDWNTKYKRNMTSDWDESAGAAYWANNSREILFTAPWEGSEHLFNVAVPGNLMARIRTQVRQITHGDFNITGIYGATANEYIVSKCDINHANEIFAVNKESGKLRAITKENDAAYQNIKLSKVEGRFTKTKDGKSLFSWVIYPPDFNPKKKYPTLLYCQGGPQSALSQFYSFRWNFQLMAAQGYIVIAPNRRGMPGWGTEWNEAISKDWGGKAIDDYLAAIDDIATEKYVDKERLGAVGASYGGYSVFMLAGVHGNRFKTFISHCGLFDLKSWYGTTEELWFANWDLGGNYWNGKNDATYEKFSPSNYVNKWNAPIMVIQGGLDFRVPIEQGQQAFQAAQLKGLKSKFLYFPNENHWILGTQNAIVWQNEFFSWLEETLKSN